MSAVKRNKAPLHQPGLKVAYHAEEFKVAHTNHFATAVSANETPLPGHTGRRMMPPSKESHTSFVVAQGCLQRLNDLANAAHNNSPASVAVTTGKQPHDGTLVEQLTANSNTDYCHSQPCQADVCFRAAAPATPPPAQRAQHAVLKNQDTKPAHSTCSNILMPVTGAQPDRDCTEEADQKLLWWPVDHVTVNKSRLAVGDSCYIITGQCVLCHVDDDLDMVECTRCSRFTHFQCTLPQLIESPQVCFLRFA